MRLVAADIVGDDAALRASLAALRRDLDEIESDLDEAEAIAETLPHRARYLRLVHRFGRTLVQAHREWLDQVERELGTPGERV